MTKKQKALYDKVYRAKNLKRLKYQHKLWRIKNHIELLEKKRKYRVENNLEILNRQRKRYKEKRGIILNQNLKWRLKNREYLAEKQRQYRKTHREYYRKYFSEHRKSNINYKLADMLRTRLKCAIRNNQKKGSAVKDLGCTIDFLKQYIESKFYSGMTWENWGTVWELDHIVPLWKFDLTNRKQFLKAINYKNLHPLSIEDHQKKTAEEATERWKYYGLKNN